MYMHIDTMKSTDVITGSYKFGYFYLVGSPDILN